MSVQSIGEGPDNRADNRVRVLHFAESLQGGVATYLSQIIPVQLEHFGHGSVCLVIHESEVAFLDTTSLSYEIHTFKGSKRSIIALLSAARALLRAANVFRPNVIHLHSSFAGLIGRILPLRRAKVVYCSHGWAFLRERTAGLAYHITVFVERLLAWRTDAIVNISRFEADQAHMRGLGRSRSVTIVNAISPVHLEDLSRFRSDIYLDHRMNVLFVGRFDRQKGFDIALDTFKLLSPDRFRLIAIGDFVLESEKEEAAPPNVTLLGWLKRDAVIRHMARADLVFMPSRWEGFGLVAIEAMSVGTPVLASSAGALPEVIENGRSGIVSLGLKPEDFAREINLLSDEMLENLGRGAQDSFGRRFTAERMNRSLVVLYEDLLEGKFCPGAVEKSFQSHSRPGE